MQIAGAVHKNAQRDYEHSKERMQRRAEEQNSPWKHQQAHILSNKTL